MTSELFPATGTMAPGIHIDAQNQLESMLLRIFTTMDQSKFQLMFSPTYSDGLVKSVSFYWQEKT